MTGVGTPQSSGCSPTVGVRGRGVALGGDPAGVALLITVLILFIVSVLGATIVSLGQVDFDLSGYTGNAIRFNLYRTDTKSGLLALGPADLLLAGAGESLLEDPALADPGIYYYVARAVNDCGEE